MTHWNRTAGIGGLFMAFALIGYAIYELVLYPGAGFPTTDYSVIVVGANTLRVGHILKFGYAIGLVLILVGLDVRARSASPILSQIAKISAVASATLLIASGMMGLRILQVAQDTFLTNQAEAIATILQRSVTIALFEAGIFTGGVFGLTLSLALFRERLVPAVVCYLGMLVGVLFILDRLLPMLSMVSPFLAIAWGFSLAWVLLRQNEQKVSTAWAGSDQRV